MTARGTRSSRSSARTTTRSRKSRPWNYLKEEAGRRWGLGAQRRHHPRVGPDPGSGSAAPGCGGGGLGRDVEASSDAAPPGHGAAYPAHARTPKRLKGLYCRRRELVLV